MYEYRSGDTGDGADVLSLRRECVDFFAIILFYAAVVPQPDRAWRPVDSGPFRLSGPSLAMEVVGPLLRAIGMRPPESEFRYCGLA